MEGNTVFTSDATATAAVTGIYIRMIESSQDFASRITLLSGLSADEFRNHSTNPDQRQVFENALMADNEFIGILWKNLYQFIYSTNAVLEGLENSQDISQAVKTQLEGEAKFIRGFCYFYLVNDFGKVPLILMTDHKVNELASRASVPQVYQQIVADMIDAKSLLSDDYVYSNGERIKPNKWAAAAMLARVYLYTQDWVNAELEATAVIDDVALYGIEEDLNNVFLKESIEAIWQLQPVLAGYNTYDGNQFILTSAPNFINTVALSDQVTGDFETDDNRMINWVGTTVVGTNTYYFPYKYKIKTSPATSPPTPLKEYLIVLRLAEQYLIRSEARAQQNKLTEAINDIDVIRQRAGVPLINDTDPSIDQVNLLSSIEHERKVELFCEWGHRWLDLKRTGKADAVLTPVKESWQSTDTLYPIPRNEILRNPNLAPQNPSY